MENSGMEFMNKVSPRHSENGMEFMNKMPRGSD